MLTLLTINDEFQLIKLNKLFILYIATFVIINIFYLLFDPNMIHLLVKNHI